MRRLMAVVVVALAVPGVVAQGATGAAAKPNIVLILTDDQDFRSLAQMARVDELLAERGTAFPNFIVSTPGCCPSRASILRGQYPHNHQVLFSSAPDGGFSTFRELGHEESTVATWLQDAGYRTAMIGKYLNEYPGGADPAHVAPGWDDWFVSTDRGYVDYDAVDNGERVAYGDGPDDYLTDVLSRRARGFVRDSSEAGAPFFLFLAPRAPHLPATPAPRHAAAFAEVEPPRAPSFDEADVGDKPSYVRETPRLSPDQIAEIDALRRDRLRALLAVDEMVEDLFATLAETDTLENTYVFFTTDNGFLLGEHRRLDKGQAYEEAIRMPLLVRGPGVPAGEVEERLLSNTDLAPTFAELAGVDAPGFVDGRSLAPLLRGEEPATWREATVVAAFDRNEGKTRVRAGRETANPPFWALRMADRVYVEYPRSGERELYDLRADPDQLENLVSVTDPAELKRLSSWLQALRACRADAEVSCASAEDAPPTAEAERARADRA